MWLKMKELGRDDPETLITIDKNVEILKVNNEKDLV